MDQDLVTDRRDRESRRSWLDQHQLERERKGD